MGIPRKTHYPLVELAVLLLATALEMVKMVDKAITLKQVGQGAVDQDIRPIRRDHKRMLVHLLLSTSIIIT